ncbi:PKD domain-containing protein [Methanosarcina sp. UBA289]|uniref:PKD domain-containing protein n=1 Tax=Methanosarcina sp. UBA289 TaxID=1915574 RepID=UPI0032E4FA43
MDMALLTTDSTNTMEHIQQMECTQHYESCTTYSKAGKYTVSLTVKNAKGSNTKTMAGYIVVSKK